MRELGRGGKVRGEGYTAALFLYLLPFAASAGLRKESLLLYIISASFPKTLGKNQIYFRFVATTAEDMRKMSTKVCIGAAASGGA